jgi:hypothetical protein
MKLPAVLLACLTLLVAVWMGTNAFSNRNRTYDTINVTGMGSRDFESDLIVWSGNFNRQTMDLAQAYALLNEDKSKIESYLASKAVPAEEIVFSSVDISREFEYYYDNDGNQHSRFSGYRLTQRVDIESKEVAKIEKVAREITELINMGVEFYSYAPSYYYTQLADLKIEMIASATEDARIRAEQIAGQAGARLGDLRNAQMGIFQIIGQNSNEDYSWGGAFNTSSKMKTATITMKLEFGIR